MWTWPFLAEEAKQKVIPVTTAITPVQITVAVGRPAEEILRVAGEEKVVGVPQAFGLVIVLTAGVFFTIGAARCRWSPTLWWHSGLSTLGMGRTAVGLAYGVGAWLKNLL